MNVLPIFSFIVLFIELSLTILTMSISVTLFLNCRWGRKKTILVFWLILIVPMILMTFAFSTTLRFWGSNLSAFILLGFVTKDKFGKRLMTYLLFSTVFIFSETIFMIFFMKYRPELSPEEIMHMTQPGIMDKLLHYNYDQTVFAILIMMLTLLIIHLISLQFKGTFTELEEEVIWPFILLGVLQLLFVFLTTTLTNLYIRGPYMFLTLFFSQLLMMFILLWMIWQLSVTGQRSRTERALEIIRRKNELDANLYAEMKGELLENQLFRHDFHNQMQIVDHLIERGEKESLEKAGDMLQELLRRLEC